MTGLSILIADDHPLVSEALAALLRARHPDARIRIIGDWPAAIAAAAADPPRLMLIDALMPGATPAQGLAAVRQAAPSALLMLISGVQDDLLLSRLLTEGVAGFLPKTAPPDVMLAAVALVLAGETYLPDRTRLQMAAPLLSPRQAEVGRLIAQGLTNKQIARALGIGPETVKTHVAQLIAILGAANRAEAAVKAQALLGDNLP